MNRYSQLSNLGLARKGLPLRECSRWKIGGEADFVIEPYSVENVSELISFLNESDLPHVVIGSTTNLLFSDDGLRAVAIVLGQSMSRVTVKQNQVHAQCGVWVPRFAKRVADAGFTGSEHMAGIPGTLGGLICMNGGSQRKGVGDNVVSVRSLSPNGEIMERTKEECLFAYRSSIFQTNGEIIVDATFEFPVGHDRSETRRAMMRILRERRMKFPQKLPNCGSVFVSNPAMYAEYGPPGAVIERCGLKGLSRGGAQISPLHANFIVNNGGATARDVLFLIHKIRSTVAKETGYLMPAEARFITPEGKTLPAHEMADELFG